MWGDGGRFYWGKKESGKVNGIVVVFAWISSQEKEIEPFVQLYASLGWNSLICHPINLVFPEKSTTLASGVLSELLKEVNIRPLPIVFAAFSGGSKACMYKVLQIIEGKYGAHVNLDGYQPVIDCICGHIYDSSPVDFTGDIGNQFAIDSAVLKTPQPPRVVSWITKAIASGMDALFPNRLEAQRAEYWRTLYSSANTGPFLLLCSDDDNLAPYQIVCNFAQHLQDLGSDVKMVKWSGSTHLGHYRHYPVEYKAFVTDLLEKASLSYSKRIQNREGAEVKISESVFSLHKAAVSSNQQLQRGAIDLSDPFFMPSPEEYPENKGVGSMQDSQKDRLIHLQDQPSISAHSVLGQILFDVCVPKNVEDWDIKPAGSLNRHTFGSSSRHSPFKCIRRSRL